MSAMIAAIRNRMRAGNMKALNEPIARLCAIGLQSDFCGRSSSRVGRAGAASGVSHRHHSQHGTAAGCYRAPLSDAHDGNLLFAEGRYYLYGTAYGKSAGSGINNRFRVYSSPDLQDWDLRRRTAQISSRRGSL